MYTYWGVLDGLAGNFDLAKRMIKRSSLTASFQAAASTMGSSGVVEDHLRVIFYLCCGEMKEDYERGL
jgi:hypothetical protein